MEEVKYKIVSIDGFTPGFNEFENTGGKAFDKIDGKQDKFILKNEKGGDSLLKLSNVVSGFVGGMAAGLFQKLASIPGKIGQLKGEALELYDVQIQAENQLKNALETTGHAAGRTFEQLQNAAEKMQQKNLYGDEVVLMAQTQLTAFRNVRGAIFDKTIELSADLATRLKTDLTTSTKLLGSALNDPLLAMRKLREAGVNFTEEQTAGFQKLVKAGKIREAQIILLTELEKNYGGAAKTAARSGIGTTKQLQNSYGDLKEELGGRLLPLHNRFIKSLQTIVSKATDFVKIPTSRKLAEERREVNLLSAELSRSTTSYERRKEIISELQRIAPDVVSGINAEAVSYANLAQNLEKYNRQKIASIAFEKRKAEGEPLYEKAATAKEKENEIQREVDREFIRIQDRIRESKYISPEAKKQQLQILYDPVTRERIGAEIGDRYKGGAGGTIELGSYLNKIGLDSRFYMDSFATLATSYNDLRKARQGADVAEFAVIGFEKRLEKYKNWLGLKDTTPAGTVSELTTETPTNLLSDAGITAIQGDRRAITNLTINIDKQIENITFNDGAGEFKRDNQTIINELKNALLTVVNDVNYVVN